MQLLSDIALLMQWVAFIGILIAGYDFYLTRKTASFLWGAVFLIGWALPMFSNQMLLLVKSGLVRFLIPNNRDGLIVGLLLTSVPWLYFLPRLTALKGRRKRR